MSAPVTPFSLKDAPALIERLLPVQKLSVESYKEQMAGSGKALTSLGGFWKGRKPLILNKACILGCLLPATENPIRDLEIFERLMAMDDESFTVRWKDNLKPKQILEKVSIDNIKEYFDIFPEDSLPISSPIDWSKVDRAVKVEWKKGISDLEKRRLQAQILPRESYVEWVRKSYRSEEVLDQVDKHIWESINEHLGTHSYCFPDLIDQLGIMRFGKRPKVADTFCGSGQIPFEAARLGCDVYASDLNPIACMLTWGAFRIIGGSHEKREHINQSLQKTVEKIEDEISRLKIEIDENGWRAKTFLYCLETRCPQTGWLVPILPSLIISKGYKVIARLIPDFNEKRYSIEIHSNAKEDEIEAAQKGTLGRDGKYEEPYLIHEIDEISYKTKISALRRDFKDNNGVIENKLRKWNKRDFIPDPNDLFQERLYCVQWMRERINNNGYEYVFRSVTDQDIERENIVRRYLDEHFQDWQDKGWIPDMQIEVGGPPRYQGLDLVRSRGWLYWHQLFNPRQLLLAGLLNQVCEESHKFLTVALLDQSSRLSRWNGSASKGAGGNTSNTFDNQALNTLYSYATRAFPSCSSFLQPKWKHYPLPEGRSIEVSSIPAFQVKAEAEVWITDPPYGDAVKYEEILDFFIAWLRKNPPPEFADWVWDSRRSLAIQGEDENFRQEMVSAYKQMTKCMPENGIQVIMFTHQSGTLWADMANIVWASGLQVSAAWYVATETDSALREGSHVKGTVLLVCRKRQGNDKTTRDDLAWDLQEEVEQQVATLTGLNQQARGLYRDENLFEDADIQMAGYAAALRVLTRYATIDGRAMVDEAIRPRVKGETTFVDELIDFAVTTANQCLVPQGLTKALWDKLTGAERFYLKMVEMEARGQRKLDNYQNFAKAFKVRDYTALMASQRANDARLKTALEFGRSEMGETSQLYQSVLRAVLYAIMELVAEVESDTVIAHLALTVPNYYYDPSQRQRATQLVDYLASHLEGHHPAQASAARVLSELIKNQRLG
jgi:putative DNA methylase